jgi:hypothetical protein
MTITLKEVAARRTVRRRRIAQSNGAATVEALRFSRDRATRNAQIRALVTAAPDVREAALRASVEAAAPFYAQSLQSGGELTEITRALQSESFRDD